jgi:hypothetical protein
VGKINGSVEKGELGVPSMVRAGESQDDEYFWAMLVEEGVFGSAVECP